MMINLDKQYDDRDRISHHCIHYTKRVMSTPPTYPGNFLSSSNLTICENLPGNNLPSDSYFIEIYLGIRKTVSEPSIRVTKVSVEAEVVGAMNRTVNWNQLKSVTDSKLVACQHCKSTGSTIEHT